MSRNWFVAWPVRNAAEWLATFAADAPTGLDLLHPADLHVTLAFLGSHDAPAEKKIAGLLRGLPFASFEISAGPLKALPQPRRFSAIVTTIDNGRLELEKQIARWMPRICRESGARIDSRAAHPHLTIGRPARHITDDERDAVLEWVDAKAPDPARLTLDPPAIFRWATKATDRRYTIIPTSKG